MACNRAQARCVSWLGLCRSETSIQRILLKGTAENRGLEKVSFRFSQVVEPIGAELILDYLRCSIAGFGPKMTNELFVATEFLRAACSVSPSTLLVLIGYSGRSPNPKKVSIGGV
jgi:hypothetical protein